MITFDACKHIVARFCTHVEESMYEAPRTLQNFLRYQSPLGMHDTIHLQFLSSLTGRYIGLTMGLTDEIYGHSMYDLYCERYLEFSSCILGARYLLCFQLEPYLPSDHFFGSGLFSHHRIH